MAYWWWDSNHEVNDLRRSVDAVRWHARRGGAWELSQLGWADDMERLLVAMATRRRYARQRKVQANQPSACRLESQVQAGLEP